MQTPLVSGGVNIHHIDIKCILCEAFLCRGAIEHEYTNAVQMHVFEYSDHVLDLVDQLAQIPPGIEAFSWVGYLSSLKSFKSFLSWALQLIADLFLQELKVTNRLADEVQDMDHSSTSLRSERLLISCKPYMLAVLICMEDGLILYN